MRQPCPRRSGSPSSRTRLSALLPASGYGPKTRPADLGGLREKRCSRHRSPNAGATAGCHRTSRSVWSACVFSAAFRARWCTQNAEPRICRPAATPGEPAPKRVMSTTFRRWVAVVILTVLGARRGLGFLKDLSKLWHWQNEPPGFTEGDRRHRAMKVSQEPRWTLSLTES